MRIAVARLLVAAACTVCLADVALAQAPGTPPPTDPGTPPPTTEPPTTPPGEPPTEPTVDPILALLQAFFEVVNGFVVEAYPDAPPEFQAWLTAALMDYLFGDLFFDYLFGGSGGR
ncbi:MAG TPA: hypothetical protein VM597_06645 [Gemmataceae bacterium]|nr:hypothetical protein [Gemmataceae bacterium]